MSSKQATLSQSGEGITNHQQLKNIDLELLGERIRQARTDQKISQRDLCKGLFTSAYLSYVELGKTRPTLVNLEKLASRLNKPVDYFLRPSGLLASHKTQGGLDREQLRNLELQGQLLQSQVALSGNDFAQVEHNLGIIRPFLSRLSRLEQSQFYLLEAGFYNALNEPGAGRVSLEAARSLLEDLAKPEPKTHLLAQLELETGLTCIKLDQHLEALNHFHKGLRNLSLITITVEANTIYRKLLWEISRCYLAVGDAEKAFEYSQRLLSLPNETNNEKAANLFKEGLRLAALGDYEQSCFYLGRSEQIWQEIKEIANLRELTLETAQVQYQTKKYVAAYQTAKTAYNLLTGYPGDNTSKTIELKVLLLLLQITLQLEDTGAVKIYMDQAAEIITKVEEQEPLEIARYFYVVANASVRLNNWEQATDYYQQGLDLLEPLVGKDNSDPSILTLLADIYYNFSQLLKKHNNSVRALEYLDKAFRLRTK